MSCDSSARVLRKRRASAAQVQANRATPDIQAEGGLGMLGWLSHDVLLVIRAMLLHKIDAKDWFANLPLYFALGGVFALRCTDDRTKELVIRFIREGIYEQFFVCSWARALNSHAPNAFTSALCKKVRSDLRGSIDHQLYRPNVTFALSREHLFGYHSSVDPTFRLMMTKPLADVVNLAGEPSRLLDFAIMWQLWDVAIQLMRPPYSVPPPPLTWPSSRRMPGWERVYDEILAHLRPENASSLCVQLVRVSNDNYPTYLDKMLAAHGEHIDVERVCMNVLERTVHERSDIPPNHYAHDVERLLAVMDVVTPSPPQCDRMIAEFAKSAKRSPELLLLMNRLRAFPHSEEHVD